MPQFFIKKASVSGGICRIEGPDYYHLTRSRRAVPGDMLTLRCEDRSLIRARVCRVNEGSLEAEIVSREDNPGILIDITLNISLLKTGTDEVIRRAVEVGVNRIVPMTAERTIPDIKRNRQDKLARWTRIAGEAAKQCMRINIPEIGEPGSFFGLLEASCGSMIVAHPEAAAGFKECPDPSGNEIELFIGPEGGFSPAEIEKAAAAGAGIYNFGNNFMRADTAGSVIPAIIIYRWS